MDVEDIDGIEEMAKRIAVRLSTTDNGLKFVESESGHSKKK